MRTKLKNSILCMVDMRRRTSFKNCSSYTVIALLLTCVLTFTQIPCVAFGVNEATVDESTGSLTALSNTEGMQQGGESLQNSSEAPQASDEPAPQAEEPPQDTGEAPQAPEESFEGGETRIQDPSDPSGAVDSLDDQNPDPVNGDDDGTDNASEAPSDEESPSPTAADEDGEADGEGTCGTAKWVLHDNGALTVEAGELDQGMSGWIEPAEARLRVVSITFSGRVAFAPGSSENAARSMFSNMSNLAAINNISYLDTGNCPSMASMFQGCTSLASLDLSAFDTGNCYSMASMFQGCASLASLDLSSFDTRNTFEMSGMFADCPALMKVVLGSKYCFNGGSSSRFPTITGTIGNRTYTGEWMELRTGIVYPDADAIPDMVAGTYVAHFMEAEQDDTLGEDASEGEMAESGGAEPETPLVSGNGEGDVSIQEIGTLTIEGEPKVGATLTANLQDSAANVVYQWAVGDSEEGSFADIGDATTSSYTVLAADVGKYLQCTATDDDRITGIKIVGPIEDVQISVTVPTEMACVVSADGRIAAENQEIVNQGEIDLVISYIAFGQNDALAPESLWEFSVADSNDQLWSGSSKSGGGLHGNATIESGKSEFFTWSGTIASASGLNLGLIPIEYGTITYTVAPVQ